MSRRFIIGSAAILALVSGSIFWLQPPRLAEQYLARQFTCSCHHTMVMEFKDGRVRLHNMGHEIFYECGSFKKDGSRIVWHLPDFGMDFILQPERSALRLTDEQTGRTFLLQRPYWDRKTSRNKDEGTPLNKYLGNQTNFVTALGQTSNSRIY